MNAQEKLWAGDFGNSYNLRNVGRVESNTFFFSHILRKLNIKSYVEFGAGTGENIAAMQRLFTGAQGHAIEINEQAAAKIPVGVEVTVASMLQPIQFAPVDLAFTKGVLIHIGPENIRAAYQTIYEASKRYILIAEYYSPRREMVRYREQDNAMWKADFAGEMLDLYPDLRLLDYGFQYHRGEWPQDDLNWFLMEKR